VSITGWRDLDAMYGGDPASGSGAREHPGRWHNRGTAVVYSSDSLPLALCEVGLEIDDLETLRGTHSCVSFEFDEDLVEELSEDDLPEEWNVRPHNPETRKLGDEWIRRQSSAVLKVPSAIKGGGYNYLLNPEHTNYAKIRISAPKDLAEMLATS